MGINLKIGPNIGPRVGPAIGAKSSVDPMAGVTLDAASGKYFPASAAEWAIVFAAAGVATTPPTSIWLCQEAAGNLADAVGGNTLTANGAPGYQQSITGYSRKAVHFTVNTVAQRAQAVVAALAPAGHSVLWAAVKQYNNTPAATARTTSLGDGGSALFMRHTSTGLLGISVAGVVSDTVGVVTGAGVILESTIYDRTNTLVELNTNAERIVGTYAAGVTGTVQGIGATSGSCTGEDDLYVVAFVDGNAEWSLAKRRAVWQRLGWTIPW